MLLELAVCREQLGMAISLNVMSVVGLVVFRMNLFLITRTSGRKVIINTGKLWKI